MKNRADFRRPESFWEEKGDMVLAVARYMGLPFYEMNEDTPEGISFCQVRYRTRKGKEKIKWLTDKPLKKRRICWTAACGRFSRLGYIRQSDHLTLKSKDMAT